MSQHIAIVQAGIDQLDKLIANAESEIAERTTKVDFYRSEITRHTNDIAVFQASIVDYQAKRVAAEELLASLQQ